MYKLPDLPYPYDALEPHIDARTMQIHHTKHHTAYVAKLNDALLKHPEFEGGDLYALLKNLKDAPEDIRTAVRNHGGGHFNHSLFWKIMSPHGGILEEGPLLREIKTTFESFEKFKDEFSKTAGGIFGSGWAWLIVTQDKKLKIVGMPNQDNPVITGEGSPILGLDVWEHAYYLKYQNLRQEYIENWWQIINWAEVEKLYMK